MIRNKKTGPSRKPKKTLKFQNHVVFLESFSTARCMDRRGDDILLWRDYIDTFSKPLTQCRRQASNHFFPELLDFPDFLIGGNYRWKICSLWTRVASWWTHFPTNNVTQYNGTYPTSFYTIWVSMQPIWK